MSFSKHVLAFEENLHQQELRLSEEVRRRVHETMSQELSELLATGTVKALSEFRLRYEEVIDQDSESKIASRIELLESEKEAFDNEQRLKSEAIEMQRDVNLAVVETGLNNPLHAVSHTGDVRLIRFLLSRKFNPNAVSKGKMPLNVLADAGNPNVEAYRVFFEAGADPRLALAKDSDFLTKLANFQEIFALCVFYGLKPTVRELRQSILFRNFGIVDICLKNWVDANVLVEWELSCFEHAIVQGFPYEALLPMMDKKANADRAFECSLIAMNADAFRLMRDRGKLTEFQTSSEYPYFSVFVEDEDVWYSIRNQLRNSFPEDDPRRERHMAEVFFETAIPKERYSERFKEDRTHQAFPKHVIRKSAEYGNLWLLEGALSHFCEMIDDDGKRFEYSNVATPEVLKALRTSGFAPSDTPFHMSESLHDSLKSDVWHWNGPLREPDSEVYEAWLHVALRENVKWLAEYERRMNSGERMRLFAHLYQIFDTNTCRNEQCLMEFVLRLFRNAPKEFITYEVWKKFVSRFDSRTVGIAMEGKWRKDWYLDHFKKASALCLNAAETKSAGLKSLLTAFVNACMADPSLGSMAKMEQIPRWFWLSAVDLLHYQPSPLYDLWKALRGRNEEAWICVSEKLASTTSGKEFIEGFRAQMTHSEIESLKRTPVFIERIGGPYRKIYILN